MTPPVAPPAQCPAQYRSCRLRAVRGGHVQTFLRQPWQIHSSSDQLHTAQEKIDIDGHRRCCPGDRSGDLFVLKPSGPGMVLFSGNGRIEATEIDIASKLAGRVQNIMVNEGDFVRWRAVGANADGRARRTARRGDAMDGRCDCASASARCASSTSVCICANGSPSGRSHFVHHDVLHPSASLDAMSISVASMRPLPLTKPCPDRKVSKRNKSPLRSPGQQRRWPSMSIFS